MAMLQIKNTRGHEMILFRRFMIRMAEKIAKESGSKALVTGDSLGQVASQTIENISEITSNCNLPIFQPLIAYDKQEIIDLAKSIETYEPSIEAYKDCCSILSSNPRTRANSKQIELLEKTIKLEEIILKILSQVSVIEL